MVDVALSVIKDFRISPDRAKEIINEVSDAVSNWRQVAGQIGLSKRECDRMSSAFEHAE